MNIVCLDLEGVLVPEIWIAFADTTGIPELRRTTRDEPDYDKLMRYRLDILDAHGLKLTQIQQTIAGLDPFPGAREFLDELRSLTQVVILSDTFSQFATPLMRKLGWPTILCNELEVGTDGSIVNWKMRKAKKKSDVTGLFNQMGYETICAGDSHNDLSMIETAKAGFLFKTTDALKADYPHIPAFETYGELLDAIKGAL
jgi:phosphoserine/homoserine phosphotransferase